MLKVIKNHESELVDLITNDQLFSKGIDGTGSKIVPEYSPFTVEFKKLFNQPYDRVTLKDEGDFHRSFFLDASKFPVQPNASDRKRDELAFKYGEEIFDFADETLPKVDQELENDLVKMFQDGINEALQEL